MKKMNQIANADGAAPGSGAAEQTLHPAETEPPEIQPLVIPRGEHAVSRRDIDPDALRVLYRLARNDFTAYLVGGGVRDLLLGRKPKDFDISTNARPEQIRALFRNCILIGRRFRLAHVRYGDKIIETSTFRSTPQSPADPSDPAADLFQRDDNLFGTPQEDAFRRDFTVNGLFYDIETFSVIDYVGGMEDLAARRIRCIGDPNIRFREDPVRMVRAVRFASRLGFALDPETEEAIRRHGEELTKASPARLLEEITRLFAFSSGEKAVRLLSSTGLLRVILPEVAGLLDSDGFDAEVFWKRLRALDAGDTVLPDSPPALIFAVLFLEPLKAYLRRDWSFETSPRLRFERVHAFLEPLSERLRFPRRLVDRIAHVYLNQSRFTERGEGKKGALASFVTQEAFHESLALAEIVLTAEGGSQARLNYWRDLLAERIFGRDEGAGDRNGRPDREHDHGGGRRGNGSRQARQESSAPSALPTPPESGDGAEDEREEEDWSGRKMSRSARRRRNKRLRRLHSPETPQTPQADPDAPERAEPPENAAPEPVQPAAAKADGAGAEPANGETRRRTRGGRGRRKDKDVAEPAAPVPAQAAEPPAAAEPAKRTGRGGRGARSTAKHDGQGKLFVKAASEPVEDAPPPKPLTAAAFWAVPEPEPEPAKKKRAGRKKDAAPKEEVKEKTADKKKRGDKAAAPAENKPLRMDKADEADIPMHWLDEI